MKKILSLLIASSVMLYSCSKNDDVLARPIKRDVTAPIVSMTQPGAFVGRFSTTTAIIQATDDMALKALYYYENGILARTWSTNGVPGYTATNWELSFPFTPTNDVMNIKIVCIDLANNMTEITRTITCYY